MPNVTFISSTIQVKDSHFPSKKHPKSYLLWGPRSPALEATTRWGQSPAPGRNRISKLYPENGDLKIYPAKEKHLFIQITWNHSFLLDFPMQDFFCPSKTFSSPTTCSCFFVVVKHDKNEEMFAFSKIFSSSSWRPITFFPGFFAIHVNWKDIFTIINTSATYCWWTKSCTTWDD